MTKEESYEQIERYIGGDMSSAERADFTRVVEGDPVLKEEITVHRGVQALAQREAFIQTLSAAASDHFAGAPVQTGGHRRLVYWSAAAAVVLLAAIGIFLWQQPAPPSAQELYTAYFTPYEIPTALRSEGSIYTDADVQQAFSLYSQQDYAGAIPFFSKALARSYQGSTLLVFSRGICYLATGDTHGAEQDLKTVINSDDGYLFAGQARWYLALTHLRAGDVEAAQTALRTVESPQAKALLRELE